LLQKNTGDNKTPQPLLGKAEPASITILGETKSATGKRGSNANWFMIPLGRFSQVWQRQSQLPERNN
jgi:hypothetical protein